MLQLFNIYSCTFSNIMRVGFCIIQKELNKIVKMEPSSLGTFHDIRGEAPKKTVELLLSSIDQHEQVINAYKSADESFKKSNTQDFLFNLERLIFIKMFTKFYDKAIQLCFEWIQTLQKYQQPFTGIYLPIMLELYFENCRNDRYQDGLIVIYQQLIRLDISFANPICNLDLLIRNIQNCSETEKEKPIYKDLEQNLKKVMNYHPYFKNLLQSYYEMQIRELRKMPKTAEIQEKISEFLEKFKDLTIPREKDPIYYFNKKYIALLMQSDTKRVIKLSDKMIKIVNDHSTHFKDCKDQLLFYLNVLVSYKEILKQKEITNKQSLYEMKFPGVISLLLQDLKQKKRKLKKNLSKDSLNQRQINKLKQYSPYISTIIQQLMINFIKKYNKDDCRLHFHHPAWLIQMIKYFMRFEQSNKSIEEAIQNKLKDQQNMKNLRGSSTKKMAYYLVLCLKEKKKNEEMYFSENSVFEMYKLSYELHKIFNLIDNITEEITFLKNYIQNCEILEIKPLNFIASEYEGLGQISTACQLYEKALKKTKDQKLKTKIHFFVACLYLQELINAIIHEDQQKIKENTKKAAFSFDQCLKNLNDLSEDQKGEVYLKYGIFILKTQKPQDLVAAIDYFQKAITLNKPQGFIQWAKIAEQDSLEKCEEIIEQALEKFPDQKQIYHFKLKQIYKREELDIEKMKKITEKLEKINQGQDLGIITLNNLGYSLYELGKQQKSPEEKNKYFKKALAFLQTSFQKKKAQISLSNNLNITHVSVNIQQLQLCVTALNILKIHIKLQKFTRQLLQKLLSPLQQANQIINKANKEENQEIIAVNYFDFLNENLHKILESINHFFNEENPDLLNQIKSKIVYFHQGNTELKDFLPIEKIQQANEEILKTVKIIFDSKQNLFIRPQTQEQNSDQINAYQKIVIKIKELYTGISPVCFQILPLLFIKYFCQNSKKALEQKNSPEQIKNQLIKIDEEVYRLSKKLQDNSSFSQIPSGYDFQGEGQKEVSSKWDSIESLKQRNKDHEKCLFILNGSESNKFSTLEDIREELLKILRSTNVENQFNKLIIQLSENKTDARSTERNLRKIDLTSDFSRFARVFEKMEFLNKEQLFGKFAQLLSSQPYVDIVNMHNKLYQSLKSHINSQLEKKQESQISCKLSDLIRGQCLINTRPALIKAFQKIIKQDGQEINQKWKITNNKNRTKPKPGKKQYNHDYVINLLFSEKTHPRKNGIICELKLAPEFKNQQEHLAYEFGHGLYELTRSEFLGSLFGCYMNMAKNFKKASSMNMIYWSKNMIRALQEKKYDRYREEYYNAVKWFSEAFDF